MPTEEEKKTPLYAVFGLDKTRVEEMVDLIGKQQELSLKAGLVNKQTALGIKAIFKTEEELLWYFAITTLQQLQQHSLEMQTMQMKTMLTMAGYKGL